MVTRSHARTTKPASSSSPISSLPRDNTEGVQFGVTTAGRCGADFPCGNI